MNCRISMILPGLFVGNFIDAKNHRQLEGCQISHILAIHDRPKILLPDKHYLCVMATDAPDQNLSQYFSVCNDFIHAARLQNGNVLIHCLAGMSRSVTIAVAYIITATNLKWTDALQVVRAVRTIAKPNAGFQSQLREFELCDLAEERRRLKERFPSTVLQKSDRSKCISAMDEYKKLQESGGSSCNCGIHSTCTSCHSHGYIVKVAAEKWKSKKGPDQESAESGVSNNSSEREGDEIMPNVMYYGPKKQQKEEPKEEAKEETKEETKEVTKEETKEKTKEEAKEETKEVTKEETKEVTKEEMKEETKEETKEEAKEVTNEETKEETPEEPNEA